jgi:glycosyltransferase involved in cell wall biosynthesis
MQNKLRIAFLSAGRLIHIGPYIDFFKERGHEVFLIKYDYSEKDFGVPSYDISYGARGDKPDSKWKYLLAGFSIRRTLKDIRPDIMHGHYITSAGVISWMSGFTPYVLTAHGSDVIGSLNSRLWRFVLPKVLAKAALVNPVSEALAEHLKGLGVSAEKMLVATLGVDTTHFAFRPCCSNGAPWRLLCTRTLGQVYDPLTILKGCTLLKAKGVDFELTFAAGGPMQDELRQVASQMNMSGQIRFLGGYDNAALPELLHSHNLFISASLWDGTSISLLEAMSAGIFPVVSRIAANSALLEEGKSALMFDCGDEVQFAEAIIQAINNSPLRESAIQTNRKSVIEKADRNKNMLSLENKYYEILGI